MIITSFEEPHGRGPHLMPKVVERGNALLPLYREKLLTF